MEKTSNNCFNLTNTSYLQVKQMFDGRLSAQKGILMSYNDISIIPINDEEKFESFCLDIFGIYYNDEYIQKNGRRGQRQNGVDIYCHQYDENDFTLKWIGLQCKVRSTGQLTIDEINNEVGMADTFNPKLSEYSIITTSKRDAKLQEAIRIKNSKGDHSFFIRIFFWDDIEEIVKDQKYKTILLKHYTDFFIDSFKEGYSIGRMMTIHLGVDDHYTTQYEIILGKIPVIDPKTHLGIYYFQGLYYLIELNNQKVFTFSKDVGAAQFKDIFITSFDREMIAEWLNRSDLDKIIYDIDMSYKFSYTKEEKKNFLERYSRE